MSSPGVIWWIALAATLSCSDGTVSDPHATDPSNFAAKLSSLTSTALTGPAKSALTPLRLRVTDAGGNPVAGATVRFEVRSGGGTVSPASVLSAADGTLGATWTLGASLGAQSAIALLSGRYVIDSVPLSATATVGSAAKIVIDAGDGQFGTSGTALANPIAARVVDAAGYGVSNVKVNFRVATGGGSVQASRASTDSSGRISAQWTLGPSDPSLQTVIAAVAGIDSVTFTATVRPAYRVRWVRGGGAGTQMLTDTTGATSADTLEVQVYDPAIGTTAGIGGVTVDWAAGASVAVDGRTVNATVRTDENGKARAVWMFRDATGAAIPPTSIAKRMIATVASVGQVEFQARVFPGKAASVSVALGTTTPKTGQATTLSATVKDANGFLIPGATVSFAVDSGSVSAASAQTAADGTATVIWTFGTVVGVQTATVSATYMATPYRVTSTVIATKSASVTAP